MESWANFHCQNLSGKDITWKTTQPFFKSSCEFHPTLWSSFPNVRFRLHFNLEVKEIRADAHCQNCLSGKISCQTSLSLFQSSYELDLTLWSFYLKVKVPMPENFPSYSLQVTCASVQFNFNRETSHLVLKNFKEATSLC